MSKRCQNRKILGRMGRQMKKIVDLSDNLGFTIDDFCRNWDELEYCLGVMFSLVRTKPVVHVMGPDGELTTQKFFDLLDVIGEHGGVVYAPEDLREMEIWRDAFEKAARRLDADLRRFRKDPRKF